MAKNSDAKIKAIKKYDEKTYDRVNTRFRKEQMKVINYYCKKFNFSKAGLTTKATLEKIERDTGKTFDELIQEIDNSD